VIIYLYYQQRKNNLAHFTGSDSPQEIQEVNQIFADFCKNEIGGQDINEIRTKLNGRTLTEILEENEDYETNTDALTRQKGELEAEKKELETKYKNKSQKLDGEQCENNKLETKITSLETQLTALKTEIQQDQQEYQAQLRQINLLFDKNANNYQTIDFTVQLENQVQQTVNPHLNKAKETAYKPKEYYNNQPPFYRDTHGSPYFCGAYLTLCLDCAKVNNNLKIAQIFNDARAFEGWIEEKEKELARLTTRVKEEYEKLNFREKEQIADYVNTA
ncbi:5306_t:CDS:2, partial [Funneliformis geosporum]